MLPLLNFAPDDQNWFSLFAENKNKKFVKNVKHNFLNKLNNKSCTNQVLSVIINIDLFLPTNYYVDQ